MFFFVSAHIKLAKDTKAYGIHLPKYIKILSPYLLHKDSFIFSFATNHIWQIIKKKQLSLNIPILSPIFTTSSHKNSRSIDYWQARIIFHNLLKIPNINNERLLTFLGGIDENKIKRLSHLNGISFAAIDYYCDKLKFK